MGKKANSVSSGLPFRHYVTAYPRGRAPGWKEMREAVQAARREHLIELRSAGRFLGESPEGMFAAQFTVARVEPEHFWEAMHDMAEVFDGQTIHPKDPIMPVDLGTFASRNRRTLAAVLLGVRQIAHGVAGAGQRLGVGFCFPPSMFDDGENGDAAPAAEMSADPILVTPGKLLGNWALAERFCGKVMQTCGMQAGSDTEFADTVVSAFGGLAEDPKSWDELSGRLPARADYSATGVQYSVSAERAACFFAVLERALEAK